MCSINLFTDFNIKEAIIQTYTLLILQANLLSPKYPLINKAFGINACMTFTIMLYSLNIFLIVIIKPITQYYACNFI